MKLFRVPQKNYFLLSKKSFSYISGNGNPEKTFYISGNGIFFIFHEAIYKT